MTTARVPNSYLTRGGITVRRTSRPSPSADADRADVDGARPAPRRAASSNYEYPGRYTRWDIGFIDPPLVISARGRGVPDRGAERARRGAAAGDRPRARSACDAVAVERQRATTGSRPVTIPAPGASPRRSAPRSRRCSRCCAPSPRCSSTDDDRISASTAPSATTSPSSSSRSSSGSPRRRRPARPGALPARRDPRRRPPCGQGLARPLRLRRRRAFDRRACRATAPREPFRPADRDPAARATTSPANMPRLVDEAKEAFSAATCSRSCRARCSTSAARRRPRRSSGG